jgi:hypothetical protein
MPQMPRTSAAAVTSLVCGLLLCLPIGVVAIITGIVGISATKNPYIRGRGMAVTGLILGIIGLIVWCGGGVGFGVWWNATKPQRVVATDFITNLSQGDIDGAAAQCADSVKRADIQSAIDLFKNHGAIAQKMVFANASPATGGSNAFGTITFRSGQQVPVFMTMKDDNGTLKITQFNFAQGGMMVVPPPQPRVGPSTQP